MSQIIQQVNLYQDQFKPVKEFFSLSHIVVAITFICVVLAGFTWTEKAELQKLDQQVKQLASKNKSIRFELKQQSKKKNNADKSAVSESQIKAKEKELISRRELLHTLTNGNIGSTKGFSGYMSALARQRVEGSWITGLSVQQGGKKLTIAGSSMKPEMAPVYLQNLAKEEIFSGKIFDVMELSRKEVAGKNGEIKVAEQIDFIFRSDNDDVLSVKEMKNGS